MGSIQRQLALAALAAGAMAAVTSRDKFSGGLIVDSAGLKSNNHGRKPGKGNAVNKRAAIKKRMRARNRKAHRG
jgi:hypothetical protein